MRRKFIHHIEATMECLTGLHVGGSQDELQIGGTDLPVLKHPVTLAPYVAGSSLKGKMRAELEKQYEKYGGRDRTEPCGCAEPDCPVCRVFGPHKRADHHLGPTRLMVRDGHLAEGGQIEIKTENVINRRTGAAEHPRQLERVASGAKFRVQMVVHVYDLDDSFRFENKQGREAVLGVVREGLELVEKTGLGAATSRGSGHIRFTELKLDGQPWNLA